MVFSWEVTRIQQDRMYIQLMLEHPEYISMHTSQPDHLQINIHDEYMFVSIKSRIPIAEGASLVSKIPKQIAFSKQAQVEGMEAQASLVNDVATGVTTANFIINVLLASSLSLLWGLINSLQLKTHFPLANFRYPINAAIWYGTLYKVATFDIVSTEALEALISQHVLEGDDEFLAEQVLSESMLEAGHDNADSINGSLIILLFIAAIMLIALISFLVLIFCGKCAKAKRLAAIIM